MQINLDVPDQIEEVLRRKPATVGQDLTEYLQRMVVEEAEEDLSNPLSGESPDDFMLRLRTMIHRHAIRSGHVDNSRESIYSGRGEWSIDRRMYPTAQHQLAVGKRIDRWHAQRSGGDQVLDIRYSVLEECDFVGIGVLEYVIPSTLGFDHSTFSDRALHFVQGRATRISPTTHLDYDDVNCARAFHNDSSTASMYFSSENGLRIYDFKATIGSPYSVS